MLELWRLQMRTARMMTEAQTVIGMRMLGMAGLVPSDAGETTRMVREKQAAFAKSGMAVAGALMSGGSVAQAYGRGLTPIGRTTRANMVRLTGVKR